jgi:3-demethoxyubiquinol 3-hydroxylase
MRMIATCIIVSTASAATMITPRERQFSPLDQLCLSADQLLRSLFVRPAAGRPSPAAATTDDSALTDCERRHAAGLMRVNHVGEVCAQALYLGQALTARDQNLRAHLLAAARDEADHLAWCAERVHELDSHLSRLNPLWFGGAFVLGAAAGLAGDGWNLGFVVETERQVEAHLDGHLSPPEAAPEHALPGHDGRSRAIIEQMKHDEVAHANAAQALGARELPQPVKQAMRVAAKLMTTTAYRI